MKKSDGKMIVTSTPSGPNRHFEKWLNLGKSYGASPEQLKKTLTDIYPYIWIDEILPEELTWWTKDGRPMQIEEMETSHIQNSLRAVAEGKIRYRSKFIVPMKKELARRNSELGEIVYGDVRRVQSATDQDAEARGNQRQPRKKRKQV